MTARLDAVRASACLPNIVAVLERQRDFARDLGEHGIGAMQGRPYGDEQRAAHREMERVLNLLISELRGES